jgi:hypothetical protein
MVVSRWYLDTFGTASSVARLERTLVELHRKSQTWEESYVALKELQEDGLEVCVSLGSESII